MLPMVLYKENRLLFLKYGSRNSMGILFEVPMSISYWEPLGSWFGRNLRLRIKGREENNPDEKATRNPLLLQRAWQSTRFTPGPDTWDQGRHSALSLFCEGAMEAVGMAEIKLFFQ